VEVLRDHLETMTAAERGRFLGMLSHESQRMRRLTGLRLSIVRSLVESNGGAVELANEADRGVSFVVWLPAV
jgi:K+-sensing histidine kinase KdpD